MAQPFTPPCDRGKIDAEPCPREAGREISSFRKRVTLAACVLASSMAFIDGSALTVALPALKADFGADLSAVQWVLNGYILALAALTLIGGALADAYGKARMLTIGCVLFALASAACALAPSPGFLIAARIAQGAAAAIVTPASLALIGAVYPKEERAAAIGVWAAASALTTAGGPVLGGWLTQSFGWPAIFWINPPLALAAVLLLVKAKPTQPREPRRFDLTGAAVLAGALAALAYGLGEIGGGEAGIDHAASPAGAGAYLVLLVAAAGAVAYAWWERRTDHPMTPPRLFSNRAFTGLNLATLAIYTGLSIMFFMLPFDLVERRGMTATEAGLAFLPFTLGVGFLSRAFGGLADRLGARRLLIAGSLAAAVGFLAFIPGENASLLTGIILPMGALGLAFAVLVAPLTAAVMSSVPDRDEGLASGMNNTASRIAQMIGVALGAGFAGMAGGYALGMALAAGAALLGAGVVAFAVPAKTR